MTNDSNFQRDDLLTQVLHIENHASQSRILNEIAASKAEANEKLDQLENEAKERLSKLAKDNDSADIYAKLVEVDKTEREVAFMACVSKITGKAPNNSIRKTFQKLTPPFVSPSTTMIGPL